MNGSLPTRSHTPTVVSRAVLSALAALLLLAPAETTSRNDAGSTFLAASFGVTRAELARIDAGHVVARTMNVSDKREVATLGVVRIGVTPEFYVKRLADIASFKRDEAILQIGTFGNPPELQDVADLTLDESDIRSLRACRVGRCGVQLSAQAIDRFRRDVAWERPDAAGQANSLMRRILVEYVTGYLEAGASASMQYADQPEPIHLGREFVALADSDAAGWLQFPALRRHLFDYPAVETAGTVDLVYWSKEKVGRRAVVSVTHLAISRATGDSPADYVIASKHIYGSHYFDASLGLTVLLRDHSASPAATYLAYFNRSRVDMFGGMFGGITRQVVSAKARSTVASQLARLQQTLERQIDRQAH